MTNKHFISYIKQKQAIILPDFACFFIGEGNKNLLMEYFISLKVLEPVLAKDIYKNYKSKTRGL